MADTAEQAKEALQHITAVLTTNHDALGQIQDGLAGAVENAVAPAAQFVDQTRRLLRRRTAATSKVQNGLVGNMAGQLGQAVGASLLGSASAVSTLGSAAVGGRPQAPAGGGVAPAASTGAQQVTFWCVAYRCSDLSVLTIPQLDYTTKYQPNGYLIASCGFSSQPQAQAWIDSGGAVPYLAGNCQQQPPPAGSGLMIFAKWTGCDWQTDGAPVGSAPPAPDWIDTGIRYTPTGNPAVDGPALQALIAAWIAGHPMARDPNCAPQGGGGDVVVDDDGGGAGGGGAGGGGNVPCPPPVVCPPPVEVKAGAGCPIAIPALTCQFLVGGKLPQVGSAEWCRCIEAVSSWLDGIGLWVAKKIDSILDEGDSSSEYFKWGAAYSTLGASLITGSLWKALQETLFGSTDQTRCLWDAIKAMVGTYAEQSSPRLLGLTVCRTLLKALKRLRIGWDLAVVGTVELDVSIGPLDQLLDYIEHYNFRYEIPSIGEAIDCLIQHTVPHDQGVCWMACHGADFDTWLPVAEARREKLQPHELIQWGRRNNLPDADIQTALQQQGWIRKSEAAARVALYDELPSLSDVLHFQQRNVFDTDYVRDYGLMDGYAEKFYPRYGKGLRDLGIADKTIEDHYAAHWILPPVGQLAEMLIRLRPGRVDPSIQFTSEDFFRLLAEQDLAPYFRNRLMATAYRTLPLRQLNAATQQGRFGRDELIERWQDIGFTLVNSEVMADTSLVTAARAVQSQINGFTAHLISELVEYGIFDAQEALDRLSPQGYTLQHIGDLTAAALRRQELSRRKKHTEGTVNAYATLALSAYEDGVVSADDARGALLKAGYSDDSASLALATADLRVQKTTIDLATKAVRKAFFYGAVGPQDALNALALAGVQPAMAVVLVRRWQLELTVPRISASSTLILRWVKNGLLSVANARIRLLNLGWGAGDVELQLAEVEQAIRQAQQLASQKQAAALAKAQKLAQSAVSATQKQFCKLYSTAKLLKWYALRIIDDSEFQSRLKQCGADPESIHNLLSEAQVARAAKDAISAKKGATGHEYVGSGAIPGGPPPTASP